MGPKGPKGDPRDQGGPWGLFRGHYEWVAISNGRSAAILSLHVGSITNGNSHPFRTQPILQGRAAYVRCNLFLVPNPFRFLAPLLP